MSKNRPRERVLDIIFYWFDKRFCSGNFAACDDVFRRLTPEELETEIIVGILTATLMAKGHMPSRVAWLLDAQEVVAKRGELVDILKEVDGD